MSKLRLSRSLSLPVSLHDTHSVRFSSSYCNCTALSLGVMSADFIWFMRDEVKVIWRKLGSWHARIYLFSRYTGLASQIFNVYFTARMYVGIGTTPVGCRLWFSFQAVVVQILLAAVEGILMHRLYVLFQRNLYILLILVVLATGQVSSMAISASLSVPLSDRHTVTCMVVKSDPGNAYFGVTTMTTSILIFFMTFCRLLRLPIKWNRLSIAWVMIRDTSFSLLTISGKL
ncbi:hypothetical protein OG21DRAFT_935378 [Imleria badia]|nr:hypothetical protein OG21DRAFT_935378 [Imleria badia]